MGITKIATNNSEGNCNCCGDKAVTKILGIKLCDKCFADFEKARKIINRIR